MNWRIQRLTERKAQAADASKAILDKADAEGRELTAEENATLTKNRAAMDDIQAKISREQERSTWSATEIINQSGPGFDPAEMPPRSSDMVFQNAATGETVRALRRDESFCSHQNLGDGEPNYVGRLAHAWLTGRSDNPLFRASVQQGNIDTAGGFLIEPRLSTMFVDLARAASVWAARWTLEFSCR